VEPLPRCARAHPQRLGGPLTRALAGKRANVLRNRVDSWDYALDQRLFGTILFTLLAFLFPTVLAYYALFALVRRPPVAAHGC
jgi:phosphatidylinositol glycan class Q protein